LSHNGFGGYGRTRAEPSVGLVGTITSLFRTRRELALENLALRQQLAVVMQTRGGQRLRAITAAASRSESSISQGDEAGKVAVLGRSRGGRWW
jgi:hypothetical protein